METSPSLLDAVDFEDAADNLTDQLMSALYPVVLATVTAFLEQLSEGNTWDLVSALD